MNRRVFLLIVLALILTACGPAGRERPRSPDGANLLASVGQSTAGQSLTLIDPATWAVQHMVALPRSKVRQLSRDPLGRIWVGFYGTSTLIDNRVQVYSSDGDLLHELQPCQAPAAGISFAAGRAFIACALNGFSGQVVVLDLATMAIERTIDLKPANKALMLITSAADEHAVVVVGIAADPDQPSSDVITIIDPQTVAVRAQLNVGANTDIWRVIPHGGRFYMLNAGSWRQPREQANDLLVLDVTGAPTLTPVALTPSPVWGAIEGDVLYAYHNPVWDQPNSDSTRTISRLDLRTGAKQTWPLPQDWFAGDLAVLDDQILLSHQAGRGQADDGVYRFDPASGGLKRVLTSTNANQILLPATPQTTFQPIDH
ncbi:MAG: hypothetical protein ACJ8CR_22340 [Roseiflexaceae bacterium]